MKANVEETDRKEDTVRKMGMRNGKQVKGIFKTELF